MIKHYTAALFISALIAIAPPAIASTPSMLPSTIIQVGLAEPLVSTRQASTDERSELSAALDHFSNRSDPSDLSALLGYLQDHRQSPWAAALWTNIGLSYIHDGYFSRARDSWKKAWEAGRSATSPEAKTLVDRSIAELTKLDANLGRMDDVSEDFADIGDRKISGSATESIQGARELLTLSKTDPRHLFNCGPLALRALLLSLGAKSAELNYLQFYNAGPDGTTLADLGQLATRAKLDYRLVERRPGEEVPVPSVVHWKLGHFAAIVGKANGRYHIRDAVFPNADIWVTPTALDEEASGYFLVSNAAAARFNWTPITVAQAEAVRGKGPTDQTRPGDAGDPPANSPPPAPPLPNIPIPPGNNAAGPGNGGKSNWPPQPDNAPTCHSPPLCVVGIRESSVSISLSDTPVGYVPPIGPSMKIGISYNQREDSQPAIFSYSNLGQKWTFNWLSYVIDDPTNLGANVSRVMGEGGAFYYLNYDSVHKTFAAQDDDGSILTFISQSPVIYRRQLRDGSIEIYQQSDNSTAYPRRTFLSKMVDPQGNAATLHYDNMQRLISITDATGRDTTFSYEVPTSPLSVSKITDPFGRSAKLTYDSQNRLQSITDIIGLTSSFTYDDNSLINTMVTPYGTSKFGFTAPGAAGPPRFAQVTDPMGFKEREEWLEPAPIPDSAPAVPVGMPINLTNQYFVYRNSFHWDKNAYVVAGCTDTGGCDYLKARIRHFVHMPGTDIKGTTIESTKEALEGRVWYTYPGQTNAVESIYGGTYNMPNAIGRVLDDGTSQVSHYSYNSRGNLTQSIDPSGRITSYSYLDGVNVSSVTQTTSFGAQDILGQYIYNGQQRPLFATDAAGRTTSYQYNSAGQMTSATNALGEVTTYHYDVTGNLASITNANNATAASYTYDAANRIRTFTDSEGWMVTYDYDSADRVTKVTFPDGTARRYVYDKLDLVSYEDREGRRWKYQYDSDRHLVGIVDPSNNSTGLAYDKAGNLTALTDPKSTVTVWAYDVQGRQISKTYADNSVVAYTYEASTSRLKSVLDAIGQTKQYSYAVDDDLTGLTYLNAVNPTPNVTFSFDPYFDRLVSMTDGVGVTTYSYYPTFADGAEQLSSECFTATGAGSCSHTISYGYDALSRSSSRQISGSGPEAFQYDAIGRLSQHSSDLGAFQFTYLGQTQQLTQRELLPLTSSLKTTWSYLDNAHDRRLSAIGNTGLIAGQFTNFAYETTPENLITGTTQQSDASVSEPSPTSQIASFNELNQISQVSGQDSSYDAAGNLLSDGEYTYAWDAENRLVGIHYASQSNKVTTFTYDGLGRRVEIDESTIGGGATSSKYIWCGDRLCQARDASYSPRRSYESEGEFVVGDTNPSLFYAFDQIGSVRRVFQTSFNAPTYDYDAWGVPSQVTASLADFGFAGIVSHAGSGLGLTLYRAYNPTVGRWNSRDPAGEFADHSYNLYAYVDGNPISLTDPEGLAGGRPIGTPSGTVPIDVYPGLTRSDVHAIKKGCGAGARDWTGIAPNGNVITGEGGYAVDYGHYWSYLP